jgi:hypothetical protein
MISSPNLHIPFEARHQNRHKEHMRKTIPGSVFRVTDENALHDYADQYLDFVFTSKESWSHTEHSAIATFQYIVLNTLQSYSCARVKDAPSKFSGILFLDQQLSDMRLDF